MYMIIAVTIAALFIAVKFFKRAPQKLIPVTGQAVLITGCDTGFGHGLAIRLDNLGFTVIASCLNPNGDGAKRLRQTCSKRLHVIGLDVSRDESVATALKESNEILRKSNKDLWSIVNNAGIDVVCDVEFCSMDTYHKIAEVNLFGMIRVTKAFLPLIRASKGRVLNVTSVKGRVCLPYVSVYGITKYGGENFSDVLRMEMYKFGVKVIIIEPGEFGGVTDIAKGSNMDRIKNDFKNAWNGAADELKDTYGGDYLQAHITRCEGADQGTYPNLTPVLDAFVDAIMNENPKTRYLIDGSSGWIDRHCLYARLYPYLPAPLMDYLIIRWYTAGMPKIKAQQNVK